MYLIVSRILAASVGFSIVAFAGSVAAIAQTADNVICSGCVGSKDIKNGSIKGKDIRDNSIQSRDIKNRTIRTEDLSSTVFPVSGAASSDFIDNFTSATFEPIISTTITAPAAGFLLIFGSVSAEDDLSLPGSSGLLGHISLNGTSTTNEEYFAELAADNTNGIRGASMSFNLVVPVEAGEHEVAIEVKENASGSFILGRSISVLYLANGSGVTVPFSSAGAGVSAAGGNQSSQ